jgi:pyridoxal phosphate-dependent aminotransferase EpsN
MDKRIFLSPPNMTGNEIKYIDEAFETNWIAPMGENVDKFELEVSDFIGIKSAVALSSGSAAILLSLKALGVNYGDVVFCSDLTFAGSCFAINHIGAIPVFIDSEPVTCNMSPKALEKAFQLAEKQNDLPKAVIIVDLYGNPADYDSLLPLCQSYNIPVIEDAAEAIGAKYKAKNCGTIGKIGVFSFNGNKIITTSGGGMTVSDDEEIIKKIRFWASQAREPVLHYEHKDIGYNFRLSNICAGIGRGQLTGIKEKISKRSHIKNYYKKNLQNYPVTFIEEMQGCESNNWLSVMLLDTPNTDLINAIIKALSDKNIEARPLWKPMHEQPVYKNAQFISHYDGDKNVGSDLFRRGICLPSGEKLTDEQLDIIINTIKSQLN